MTSQIKLLRVFAITGLLVAAVIGFVSCASAATTTTTTTIKTPQRLTGTIILVGTVDIRNAMITKQVANTFTVDFDLTNQVGAQPNLQYAVLLLQQNKNKTTQSVVDTKAYSDVVSLTGNDKKHISVTYTAPSFLKGNYVLAVQVKNDVGFPIGTVLLGTVALQGSGEYININQSSCYLTVPSDATATKYNTIEGVDVLPSENIIAHCDVRSTFNQRTIAVPSFANYYRVAFFGAFVASTTQDQITIAPNAATPESFVIPKAKNPQAYDAVLTLLDSRGNPISNSAIFHYVIRGKSATIQNIVFDKDSYEPGDTAKLSFLWSAAADSHPGSRLGATRDGPLNVDVRILNGQGVACASDYPQTLSATTTLVTLAIPIIAPCINPNAKVSLNDASGNVLASGSFSVQSVTHPAVNNPSPITAWASGVGVLIVLAGVAYFFIKRKKI